MQVLESRFESWGHHYIKKQIVCIFNLFYVNSIFIFVSVRCELCKLNKLQFPIEHLCLGELSASVSVVFYCFDVIEMGTEFTKVVWAEMAEYLLI